MDSTTPFPSVRDSYLSCSGFLITLFLIAGAIQVEDERRGVVRKLSAVEPDSLRCYAELDEIIPLALTSDAAIVEEMDADKAFRAFRQDQGLSAAAAERRSVRGQPDGNRGSYTNHSGLTATSARCDDASSAGRSDRLVSGPGANTRSEARGRNSAECYDARGPAGLQAADLCSSMGGSSAGNDDTRGDSESDPDTHSSEEESIDARRGAELWRSVKQSEKWKDWRQSLNRRVTSTKARPRITMLAAYPLVSSQTSPREAVRGSGIGADADADRRRAARASRVACLLNAGAENDLNNCVALPSLVLRRDTLARSQSTDRTDGTNPKLRKFPNARLTGEELPANPTNLALVSAEARKRECDLRRYKPDAGADATDTALAKALDLYSSSELRTSLFKVVRRRSSYWSTR